jgi:hypothetical protein
MNRGCLQRLYAIVWLTWKAALRFRLFPVISALLLISVVGLPLLIKDDGTARGFTQILLTYTLTAITALLGLSTLWLACGTLARDIEECQIQMVAVKPIARWEIWLGKWLGIVSLDAVLLALSGACVYGLLQWRAHRLPPDQQQVLRDEVLVARGSAREPNFDKTIDARTDQLLRERLQKNPLDIAGANLDEVRRQIRENVKAAFQLTPPGYQSRPWKINLGQASRRLRDQPLFLRVKFNTAESSYKGASATYNGMFQVGIEGKTRFWRSDVVNMSAETFHEFQLPPNLFDENGMLTIVFANLDETAILFPLEDGVEILYRQGGFGLSFARGLGILLCWMALLAALGLASASILSFPVAAFFSLGLLFMALCSGTLAGAVEEGTIANYNAEKGTKGFSPADPVVIPVFRAALKVIRLAMDFSPVDSLSTGRSVTWTQLGMAFSQIVILMGGFFGLLGVLLLSRRELATAQGTQ